MSALWAVRHAPVRTVGLCYGRAEPEPALTAEAAAARVLSFGTWSIDQVWSSPSARCREPAALVAAALGVGLHIDERLFELDFGAWEGRSWEALAREEPGATRRWADDWQRAAPPGGETVAQLERRVRAWWSELPLTGDRLLLAHAGPVRALRVIAGASWDEAMALPVPHLAPQRFARHSAAVTASARPPS